MRLLDLVVSLVGLITLSPLFLLVTVLIKLDSHGPVFYRPHRVGKDGQLFRLYKFRTMVADADRYGPGITTAGDRRVTLVGRFLRCTKIDELPQLINVFRGAMSLVGPRPEDPQYVKYYTCEQCQVLSVKPGITSLASIRYRHEEQMLQGPDWERLYLDQILPNKLSIELDYLPRRTFSSDLSILWKTVVALFSVPRSR